MASKETCVTYPQRFASQTTGGRKFTGIHWLTQIYVENDH